MERIDLWIVDSEHDEVNDQLLLNSLHNSLSSDEYIKSSDAELKLPEAPPDDMALDVVATIQLIVSAGFEFTKLAVAIMDWLSKRRESNNLIAVKLKDETRYIDLADNGNSSTAVRALTALPNPEQSACVLVGMSDYANLKPIPAVRKNIFELRRVLGSTGVWGIPDDRIYEVEYTQSSDVILDRIKTAGANSTDTLVFYFAGHGFLRDKELFLALPEATQDDEQHAIPWRDIAAAIDQARPTRKIIWLDCCHAGGAVLRGTGPTTLFEPAKRGGTYLLAATGKSARAISRHGSGCTAFTGELVRILDEGITSEPQEEFLSLNAIHQRVRDELKRKRLPAPTRHDPDDIGQIPHFHNRSKTRTPRPRPRPGPRPFGASWSSRKVAIGVGAAAVIALAALGWFIPGAQVPGGVDLTKYCSGLTPRGAQSLYVAGTSCARPVDLDNACRFSYQVPDIVADRPSPDPNSAACVNPLNRAEVYGGISNMQGYCEATTRAPGVTSTPNNPVLRGTWACQVDIDLSLACNAQNNRDDLESVETGENSWSCRRAHLL